MIKRLTLDSPISALLGVGKIKEAQLARLGVFTVRDLVYLFPRAYERRGDVKLLSDVSFDTPVSCILTVAGEVKTAEIRRGLKISKFRAFDESGACEIVFFNSPYVKDVFHTGAEFRFYGKASLSKKHIQFTNPSYEPIIPKNPLPDLVPIYPLTEGITSKFIDKLMRLALEDVIGEVVDPLPDKIRIENSLPVLSYALRNIHFPEDDEALKKALRRLAFDEMLMFGIGISLSAHQKSNAEGYRFSPCDLTPITNRLPYELTGSQKNTVNDIYKDTVFLASDGRVHPMARIVVGDVGSGKTICAVMAMYICAKSGFQCALMAPTEILARQHFSDVSKIMDKVGIKTELLVGATTQKEKNRIYSSLKSGETSVVIGTHALISDKVEFNSLGLIITDEQHRFGVGQRAILKEKAKAAHVLVMSATPIPRTLALTMYGDLDVSRITEMPKGRMRVDTYVVNESYRERLNTFILRQVENGGQCYVVCPAIEKNEDEENALEPTSILSPFENNQNSLNLKNAVEYADILRQKLPNLRIECLHGKMKSAQKDEIMGRFSRGEVDVLVSTTVIEVGVNVPNASLMVIEDADRFGLAQLHQLRGRVGRGTRKSYCVLVSSSSSDAARERLEIMRTTYDGYEIAERDLMMRGPGDFFASLSDNVLRQSGGFEFKLARLCDDNALFTTAFTAAKQIIADDPHLECEENAELKKVVMSYITPSSSTIS